MKKTRLGPETFKRVYEKWAWETGTIRKSWKGHTVVMPITELGHRRREKFSGFLFENGIFLVKENKQWYLEAIDNDDPRFTMFALQYQ